MNKPIDYNVSLSYRDSLLAPLDANSKISYGDFRKLYGFIYAVLMAGAIIWVALSNRGLGGIARICMILLATSGSIPMFAYLCDSKKFYLPLFELTSLYFVGMFAFPALSDSIYNRMPREKSLNETAWLVLLGYICLSVSYYLSIRHVKPNNKFLNFSNTPDRVLIIMAIVMESMAILSTLILPISEIPTWKQFYPVLGRTGYTILLIMYFRGELGLRYSLILWGAIVPFEIIVRLSSGLSAVLMVFFLEIFLCSLSRISLVGPSVLVVALLVGFIFQPIKGDIRKELWHSPNSTAISRLEAVEIVWHHLFHAANATIGGYEDIWNNNVSHRMNNFLTFAMLVELTPSFIPFWYGSSYADLLIKPVPRFLWPEKPIDDFGNKWAKVYGLLGPHDYTTSYNLPWIVEGYANFGIFGVLGISTFIGILFGLFYQKVLRYSGEDRAVFAYTMGLCGALWFGESHFALMWGGLLTQGLALYGTYRLFGLQNNGPPR